LFFFDSLEVKNQEEAGKSASEEVVRLYNTVSYSSA